MRKQAKKIMLAAMTAVFLCILFLSPVPHVAYANSAQTYWHGTTASGTLISGGECPLEVTREDLTFYIDAFPSNYYETKDDLTEYKAHVTASYEFYNPADYDVTATLVFPFGTYPDYYGFRENADGDTDGYDVTVNGEPVKKTLRHTYAGYNYTFDADGDLAKLKNGYAEEGVFSRDSVVYVYSFEFYGVKSDDYSRGYAPYASFVMKSDVEAHIMMSEYNGGGVRGDEIRAGVFIRNVPSVMLYSIGRPLDEIPKWTVYENGSEKKEMDDCGARHVKTVTCTFEDIAMNKYDEKFGVSRVDWFNAVVDKMKNEVYKYGDDPAPKIYAAPEYTCNVSNALMRWYEYELSVPAKTTVSNGVTAPLYPSIDGDYSPSVYGYEYLLSPASKWAAFGNLNIEIKTPFYMTASGGFGFEKNEDGYSLSLETLPNGELKFSLCSDPKPQKVFNAYGVVVVVFIIIIAVVCAAVIAGIVVISVWLIKKNKKAKKTSSADSGDAEDGKDG